MKLSGRVWKLGDDLSAINIVPARYDKEGTNDQWDECAKHLLEDVEPSLAASLRPGDILVAGEQLGCGHAHYYRATIMTCKAAGLAALLGESVNDLFQRAAIDQGLPTWAYPGLHSFVATGDHLEIDLASGTARNVTAATLTRFKPLSPIILDILAAGGGFGWARRRAATRNVRAEALSA